MCIREKEVNGLDYLERLLKMSEEELYFISGALAYKAIENRPNGTIEFFYYDNPNQLCCSVSIKELESYIDHLSFILPSYSVTEEELLTIIARGVYGELLKMKKNGIQKVIPIRRGYNA